MIKLVLTGLWVCAVTLASVYFSVQMATAPATNPDDAKKAQQEFVKGESINVPVIANGQVNGYFITRISFMMEKGKAGQLQMPLTELTTDELYSLLVGNKAIDISHTASFDVASFRSDIKKNMNERLGGDYVADVLVEQLDYLSKDEINNGDGAGKRTVKPVKIVQGDAAPDAEPKPAH
ncbi:hypothetical protein [Rhizobium leucaenae]|uniref:Flagellar basal body-associated FliL family protein n=1 Tax=Rhizobium leucaenae TaxID=29450 RepID=A0A7W6ZRB3_9HYPH|nr:hypothetical protein [Rhizobium leucaenae]MBB4567294.1 hypothetical protein [Rhizobium leucaenae]MBB6303042.1 hypothetical protein [Rhizobium leucaenae]